MVNSSKFYRCNICGNFTHLIAEGPGAMMCCGRNMENVIANSTDASFEKHVPAAEVADGTLSIKVGEVAHPMEAEHHIEWIFVEGETSGCLYRLEVGAEPEIAVPVSCGKLVAAYAYCNIHDLFMVEL